VQDLGQGVNFLNLDEFLIVQDFSQGAEFFGSG
jgi:hypothetical protein